ncbi:MAG: hypothetical protein LIP11_09995 [Clostridiales bacterium]|nr:hypothetical protein [Clostridiales bacterium]
MAYKWPDTTADTMLELYRNIETAFQAQKCVQYEDCLRFVNLNATESKKLGHSVPLRPDFYRKAFYEELETFMEAFIQKQQIFSPDAPFVDAKKLTEEKLRRYEKIAEMKGAIEKKTRTKMIEKTD